MLLVSLLIKRNNTKKIVMLKSMELLGGNDNKRKHIGMRTDQCKASKQRSSLCDVGLVKDLHRSTSQLTQLKTY